MSQSNDKKKILIADSSSLVISIFIFDNVEQILCNSGTFDCLVDK